MMDIILRQMDIWYANVPGRFLFEAERNELNKILPNISGRHLLQIGGPSEQILFETSPILHRVRFSPESNPVYKGVSVQGTFSELPFLPASMDLILLPHVLEFLNNPQEFISQVATILKPEGYLIILGFNPYSLWGIYKHLSHHRYSPWKGHFWSEWQVRNWLKKSDLVVTGKRSLFYRPPIKNKILLHNLLFLEPIGRVSWTTFGAVYLLVVRKKVPGMTLLPLRKKKRDRIVMPDNILQPSRRS